MLDVTPLSAHTKQPETQVGHPEGLLAVFDDGPRHPAGNNGHGDEPVLLQVADAARCRKPQTTLTVLEDRRNTARHSGAGELAHPARQKRLATRRALRDALLINRHRALSPSVQAVRRAKPHASVAG